MICSTRKFRDSAMKQAAKKRKIKPNKKYYVDCRETVDFLRREKEMTFTHTNHPRATLEQPKPHSTQEKLVSE